MFSIMLSFQYIDWVKHGYESTITGAKTGWYPCDVSVPWMGTDRHGDFTSTPNSLSGKEQLSFHQCAKLKFKSRLCIRTCMKTYMSTL